MALSFNKKYFTFSGLKSQWKLTGLEDSLTTALSNSWML